MDMAIPDHVKQNLASIQADLVRGWQTTLSSQPAGSQGFDQFLNGAVSRARDSALDSTMLAVPQPAFIPVSGPSAGPGGASSGLQAFLAGLSATTPVTAGAVSSEAILKPGFQSYQQQQPMPVAGAPIDDAAFYDGNAMTPGEIDRFLKVKGSPFADQTFENGKTAGQLIWETCQKTGSADGGGPRTLNPAMLVAIMGAETSFGKDGTWSKSNPFSIRLNGSFDTVQGFASSLKIAANTMYNWGQARPANDGTPLFDYAGSHYCEDYGATWKPNVEKFYRQARGLNGESLA